MTTSAHDASLVGQQKLEQQDLVRFKVSMDALKRRLSDPEAKDKQLRKACRNFEAVFIGKLWEQMRATVPKEGYLHSHQEDAYLSMFDQAFSEKMADSGGMGLADMLYGHLKERLADMGRNALPGRLEVPAAPEQAPAGGEAAPAIPAQVSETPAIKPLAESGRDSRQTQERQRIQPVGRRQDLRPLHSAAQVNPLPRPGSRFAPQQGVQPAALPAVEVPVAETPEQVAAQLEELVRRIEASEQQSNVSSQPAQPVAAPQEGARVYRGQQSGVQRPGRKLAKIG